MRALTAADEELITKARDKAEVLYAGVRTPHRSCGICLAETFDLPTASYQALRRGGISGCGSCGAIVAGQLVLGELFGDADPRGAVTETLRAAMADYERLWQERLDKTPEQIVCNTLVGGFADFRGPERASFCTSLAATVAELVARVALAHGYPLRITPIADLDPE